MKRDRFLKLFVCLVTLSFLLACTTPIQIIIPAHIQKPLLQQPSANNSPSNAPSSSSGALKATVVQLPTDVTVTIGGKDGGTVAPLLGVNMGPKPAGRDSANADLTNAYQKIGVRMIRNHDFNGPLDMAVMYPDRTRDPSNFNSYDFQASDAVWRAIVDGGFEPYFRLGDSYNNVKPPLDARERANWVRAAVEVIRHYRQGKWNGFTTPFRYVEIWNEPDNRQFWPTPHSIQEFFQLYVETAVALKQAFPDLLIGGPAVTQMNVFMPQGNKWIHGFLTYVKQNNAPLDFLSWHLYSNNPTDWTTAASFYRKELEGLGFQSTRMHITEWNTDIRQMGDESTEAVALRSGSKGAAILTAAWIAMQKSGIDVSTFYRGPDPDINVKTFYGMFFADGRPKKIALAFSLWAKIADHSVRRAISTKPESDLWFLAGQNESGEIALLVTNPTSRAVRYTISGVGNRQFTLLQVNDSFEQVQSMKIEGQTIEIGGESIQLIILGS